MKITDFIKNNTVILDGGMGTILQAEGLSCGESPERWNITHPDVVTRIHKEYLEAGSNVICTNTFGANGLKFTSDELENIIASAVINARGAIEAYDMAEGWVALDVGPTGRMLKPLGDLDFEDAVSIFAETIRLGVKYGVDLIFIETMSDSYETKAALLAAKENSSLPVFVSNAYGEDGKLMTGATPAAMVALLEGMGADAIGVNCSLGPKALYPVVREYLKYSSLPVIFKPNAGLPRVEGGETIYDLTASDFAEETAALIGEGVRAVGGCCGTTPEYIKLLNDRAKRISPIELTDKQITVISSCTHAVEFGEKPILIGERINPTGKPRFREAVKSGNLEYILKEAIGQQDCGVQVLDVNLGIPGIDEAEMLCDAICSIQEVCDLPLQIDTANDTALERSLRRYNGKAMINSVNGKAESLNTVLPLVKKYGGVVVGLTLDENGIPEKAEERVEIARKIICEAKKWGIDKKNIIFDPLAMAVSADKNAPGETLRALAMIKKELGAHTSLGISNVSFGLPNREYINSSFFTMALSLGMSAAIINPYSDEMLRAYYSHLALMGVNGGINEYISFTDRSSGREISPTEKVNDLRTAIVRGLRDAAKDFTEEALKSRKPLDIVNNEIIPALDQVGEGYENKRIFLPALLMSAEAAGTAFEVIRSAMPEGRKSKKCSVVLATVKGDVHDIGKNIVKMILENYGFSVIDLGKDVPSDKIAEAVVTGKAKILGLSALMTTTLPAMEEAISLVRENAPWCKIMVGGAVLNEDYAKQIGADFYGKDAMDAVKFAEKVNKG